MSLFDELGLGEEYSQSSEGLGQYTSKPSPKPYQPFGGPIQNNKPTVSEQQIDPYLAYAQGPQQQANKYASPFDDDLDIYDELNTQRKLFSQEYSALNKSAGLYEDRYKDFVNNKLKPFYSGELEGFEDFDNDDDYITAIDEGYNSNLQKSKQADGMFGPDDGVVSARNNLKKYIKWNQPNGLKDQFTRLKTERDARRARAEEFKAREAAIIDKLTSIPLEERRNLDEQSKFRKKPNVSEKAFNAMLDSQTWEKPFVDLQGRVTNLEKTDPRKTEKFFSEQDKQNQKQRFNIAAKGEVDSILQKRDYTRKERSLRDRGIIASRDGMMDGYPIGMSRRDVDLLDIDKMRKAGIKEYRGRPLEEALNELGGEDRLRLSKILNAVYTAQNNWSDSVSEFYRSAGSVQSKKLKKELEEKQFEYYKTIKLASEFGLDNELFEQAGTTGYLSGIGNAIKRGMLMSDMSDYTPDFLTNTLEADEMEEFIDLASQMEDLPTSKALARYKKVKSKNFVQALGRLLFNNADAIPELFLESMASFLPATFKWAMATVPAGAAAGSLKGLKGGAKGAVAGAITGGAIGARSAWGVASFTLEMAGEVQAAMQELNIDWKNPQMYAAAWNNETTRKAIVEKAAKKAGVIGLFDLVSANLAGKITGLKELGLNGGKIIDGASWADNLKYASSRAPRFTNFQKGSNVALEIGSDSTLGMAGEFFGQAWAKEPGEAWDWDAVAAEGIIGVGPGYAGAFLQNRTQAADDFSTAPIEYSDVTRGPEGERGTINRAGFVREYQTYSSAQGMADGILRQSGIDESNMDGIDSGRKIAAVYDWVGRLWMADKDKMQNLRVVFTDRTPLPADGYEGSFERDDLDNGVMYINSEEMKNDPIGVFFHEAGHLARHTMFEDKEIVDLYEALGSDEKLQAFTEYYKKVPNRNFNQYSENEQKEIQKAYKRFSKGGVQRMADEWFSYQFVRLLAGGTPDKSVKSDMQAWLQKYAYPFLKEYVGSEKAAGNQKDVLNARILSYMKRTPRGFVGPFNPNKQMADVEDSFTDFNEPGMQAPAGVNVLARLNDSEGLNFLIGRIMSGYVTAEERQQVAKDFNTFMGKKILDENLTFWTERQAEQISGASQELDRQRNEEGPALYKLGEELEQINKRLKQNLTEQEKSKLLKKKQEVEQEIKERTKKVEDLRNKTLGGDTDQEIARARKTRELLARASIKELTEDSVKSKNQKKITSNITSNKRDAEEFKQGRRFRVILAQPGRNQLGTEIKYFKTRAEANAAARKFEQKHNIDRIKRIKDKHNKMQGLMQSDQKFKTAVAKSKKALKEKNKDDEPSIHAIVAHMFDLESLMRDSLFGSNLTDANLAEDSQSQKKPPSMREIHAAIWQINQDLDDAVALLDAQEASLKNEIYELRKADAEIKKLEAEDKKKKAAEKKKEEPKKKEKPKTVTQGKVIQVMRDKTTGRITGVFELKDGKRVRSKHQKRIIRSWKYVKKPGVFKNLSNQEAVNKAVNYFKKAIDSKYHNQIEVWSTQVSAKNKKAKAPATKVSRLIESSKRGLVKISDEIKDAERALQNVRDFRDTLMPEQAAVYWADTFHPHYKDESGNKITFGQLASSRKKMRVFDIRKKGKSKNYGTDLSNPQQTLLEFARSFDKTKVSGADVKAAGLKTKEEYAMHMEAILAAVMNRSDFMNKPGGYMKISGKKQNQQAASAATNVNWGKAENKILSNFSPVEGGLTYEGKTYNTVEGAYQANKSGIYVEGFEELTGEEAKKKGASVEVDKNTNKALMKELLEIRYANDSDFKEALDSAGVITHDVSDNFWKTEFPRILMDIREVKPEVKAVDALDAEIEIGKDNTFGGFQAEKGTNYFLLASYKLAKQEFDAKRQITLTSPDPSLAEHAMYEVANGKAYEDRGGAYENKAMYRYFSIVNRRIQHAVDQIKNIDKYLKDNPAGKFDDTRKVPLKTRKRNALIERKLSLEKQIRAMILEPDDLANYAEEDQYFPKILPGSDQETSKRSLAYSFSEYLYLDEVEQAINDYLDYEFYYVPDRIKPIGLEGEDKKGLTPEQLRPRLGQASYAKYIKNPETGEMELNPLQGEVPDTAEGPSYSNMNEWVAATKQKFGNLKVPVAKEIQRKSKRVKPLFFDFPTLDLSAQPDEVESEYNAGQDGPDMPSSMVEGEGDASVKKTYQRTGYNYREVGEEANDQIPERTDVHGGFKRSAVDEPIDIMKMLRDIAGSKKDQELSLTPGRFDSTKLIDFVEPEDGTIIEFDYSDDTKTAPSQAAKKIKAIWKVDKEFGDAAWHYTDAANKKIQTEIESVGGSKVKTKLGVALEDAWMTEVDKRMRSGQQDSNSVTLAELAEWIYRGQKETASLKHLANLPSIKVKGKSASEMSGAPGGGLLMFVYESFIKKAYDLLNIREFEFETQASEPVSIQQYEESVSYKNSPAKIIIDENGGWGLYRVDSLGSVRIPKVSKQEFEKLLKEKRGRTLSEVIKALKQQSSVSAEDVTVDAEGKTEVFRTVNVKYKAKKFYVTTRNEEGKIVSKLEPRSLFADSELIPDYEYIRKSLAPIMQAVIDARRLDLTNESRAGEDKVFASDTQRREEDRSGRLEDAPEGSFDNTEQETDTSKDQGLTKESDLATDISQPDIDEDRDLSTSTMAEADEITNRLSGTDTMKQLFVLKNRLGDKFTVYDVAREMQNDPRLWTAFGLPRPPKSKYFKNLAGNKPDALYQYVEKLKKQPNWPMFEKRILQGGTETLGSNYILSASLPEDFGKVGSLTSLVSRVGDKTIPEKDREKFKKMLKNFNIKTSIVDQADPAQKVATRFFEVAGLTDKKLMEQLDIHGLWHLYYGKGKDLVEKAQNNYIQPIKDALLKHNLDFETFGEYLLARATPSRNMHLKKVWTDYAENLEGSKKEGVLKFIEERKDDLSGISTQDAEKVLADLESQTNMQNFLADPDNPLQLFYDMNKEALRMKRESGLIKNDGTVDEYKAMVTAMSKYSWKGKSKAKLKDDYSYAPMQGFSGETESLYDAEESYERVGKRAGGTGKGFDQPKHMLLQKGAFGRLGSKGKDGKSKVVGPDPKTVFAVAQEQYFDSAIRSSKTEVSNSLGRLYEIMRAIAYPKEKDNIELPPELKKLDDTTKEAIQKEYDRYFEKGFTETELKTAYEFKELDYEIDGSKVEGLRMVRKQLNKSMQNDPLVFVYRVAGTPKFIKFKSNESGASLAASMKNLNHQALPWILEKVGTVTKYLAQTFTSMNPAFLFPNFIKDLGTAAIHLREDDKKELVKDAILTPKNLKGAFWAAFKQTRAVNEGKRVKQDFGGKTPEQIVASGNWDDIFSLFKAAGGKVSYFRHKPITELIEELQEIKSPKSRRFHTKFFDLVDELNTGIENSIRVSTFAAAIKSGRSLQESALIARNITVDFNQKGTLTQAFGSAYVFFGASVNSAHRLVKTFKRRGTKGSLKLLSGLVGLGALISFFNRMLDDDEDEAVPDYDTISPYVRGTNIILPLPGNFGDPTKGDTGYLKIPIPLGYNMFYDMGASAADFMWGLGSNRGGIGLFDFLTRNISNFFNSFNPIGGASIVSAVTPTGAQPIIEAVMNENFMGSQIRKTKGVYETPQPGHMQESPRTQEYWKDFSRFINKMGGGTDATRGSLKGIFTGEPLNSPDDLKWDISGSQLEHIFLGYTGGPGQILNMIFGSGIYPAFDDSEYDLTINKTPVLNRFIRTSTYGSQTRRMYYKVRETVNEARAELKRAENLSASEVVQVKQKYNKLISLHPMIKTIDGYKKKIRNQTAKIEKGSLSNSQKRQRIEELERKELNMLTKLIKKAQENNLV